MTVYCPSCGKPNTNEASACVACGTALSSAGASKGRFKGTMMMTGPATKPGAPSDGSQSGTASQSGSASQSSAASQASAAAQPTASPDHGAHAAPTPNTPPPPRPEGSGPVQAGSAAANRAKPAFKGTMMMGAATANAGPVGQPTPPPSAAPTPAEAPTGTEAPPPEARGPIQASSSGARKNMAFQATMLGPMNAPTGAPLPSASSADSQDAPEGHAAGGSTEAGASLLDDTQSATGMEPVNPEAIGASAWGSPAPSAGRSDGTQEHGQQSEGGWGAVPSEPPPASRVAAEGRQFGSNHGAPNGATPSAQGDRKKVMLIAGLGCLGLIVLSCVGAMIGLFFFGSEVVKNADILIDRGKVSWRLGEIVDACAADPSGKSAAVFAMPGQAARLGTDLCQVNDALSAAVVDVDRTKVDWLELSVHTDLSDKLGLKGQPCALFTVDDSAELVMCFDGEELLLADVKGAETLSGPGPGVPDGLPTLDPPEEDEAEETSQEK